ncbi:hypothetical protein C0J52_15693 [Blattella germanica]|nr:hypothetical protein C0J52_15693 [Blattella germanica]
MWNDQQTGHQLTNATNRTNDQPTEHQPTNATNKTDLAVKKVEDKVLVLAEFVQKRTKFPENLKSNINKSLSYFITVFKKKWQESSRKEEIFLQKNIEWLETSIKFPNHSAAEGKIIGRPQKQLQDCTERSKRNKTENLRALNFKCNTSA